MTNIYHVGNAEVCGELCCVKGIVSSLTKGVLPKILKGQTIKDIQIDDMEMDVDEKEDVLILTESGKIFHSNTYKFYEKSFQAKIKSIAMGYLRATFLDVNNETWLWSDTYEKPIKYLGNKIKLKKLLGGFYVYGQDYKNNLWFFKNLDEIVLLRKNIKSCFFNNITDSLYVISETNNLECFSDGKTKNFHSKHRIDFFKMNPIKKIRKIIGDNKNIFFLYKNGSVFTQNIKTSKFTKLKFKMKILDIFCNTFFIMFLCKTGEIFFDIPPDVFKMTTGIVLEKQEDENIYKLKGKALKIKKNMSYKIRGCARGFYFLILEDKKQIQQMKDCSHCKKKILIGKEFFYKRRLITTCQYDKKFNVLTFFPGEKEKFFFHFECLRELPEDFQEEIKNKMKRNLL